MTKQRFIDLLAMSRFANLPTVWSNAIFGFVVASGLTSPPSLLTAVCITLGLSCLYLGGCFLNDWQDLEFDAQHRSGRPIPSGRWSRKTIASFALILLLGGVALIFYASQVSGLFSLGILACILLA